MTLRRADARQHQQRRQQRAQFAHHHNHHRRAEITDRADFRQSGNRLADDEKPQRQRHEEKHRQQRHARAGDFLPDARPDDILRHAVFFQNDAERDERKRAESLHRQQKEKQFPPQQIRVGFRQRRAPRNTCVSSNSNALARFPRTTPA